jgi:hypothetical protein
MTVKVSAAQKLTGRNNVAQTELAKYSKKLLWLSF